MNWFLFNFNYKDSDLSFIEKQERIFKKDCAVIGSGSNSVDPPAGESEFIYVFIFLWSPAILQGVPKNMIL